MKPYKDQPHLSLTFQVISKMGDFLKKIANSVWKTGNTEVKIQELEDGSREEGGGSQEDSKENTENEATEGQVFDTKIEAICPNK